jgi:uncharacterized phage-associated protein
MYRAVNNDKIGNLLALLASKVPDLGITKLSKLLFLIDERAVKETGVPVTWVQYEAWHLGPVPAEIYFQIKNNENVLDKGKEQTLSQFVDASPSQINTYDGLLITPKVDFCDDEFSDYEIALIEDIVSQYGAKPAAELVNLTHAEGSLWASVVEKEGLKTHFESGVKRTQVSINLHHNITEKPLINAYSAAYESMQMREFHYLLSENRAHNR